MIHIQVRTEKRDFLFLKNSLSLFSYHYIYYKTYSFLALCTTVLDIAWGWRWGEGGAEEGVDL